MVKRRTMPGAVKILDISMNQKEKIEVGISMKVDENLLDRKIENCVFVKTILMLLVILYHSCVFWNGTWFPAIQTERVTNPMGDFALWLNTFHVYAFVLVSGYIFSYLKNEKGKYSSFRKYVIQKGKRLLIPYCFVALTYAMPVDCAFYNYSAKDLFMRYGLATAPSHLWFLITLFGCFVLVWWISDYIQNSHLFAVLVITSSFLISIIGGHIFQNYFCIWTIFRFLPIFVFGMKLHDWDIFDKIPTLIYIGIDIILFVIWGILRDENTFFMKLASTGISCFLSVIGALMAWSALQMLGNKISWKANKVFKVLSSYSMPVYLFHQQIIYFSLYWLNGKLNPYLHAACNFIFALIASIGISYIMMRWKFTRFLIGEK